MSYRILVLFAVIVALLTAGCDSSGTDSNDNVVVTNTSALLALNANSHSTYVQYDSIYRYFPDFGIEVDTTEFTFELVGLDTTFERVDIHFDSTRSHSLKITSTHIVNLGYYRQENDTDTLAFFAQPPEVFPLTISKDSKLESYTPAMLVDSKSVTTSQLYLSWGFEIERSFVRTESLLLPVGQFNCVVIKNEFHLPDSDSIYKTEYEYYAQDYGLVKLYSTGLFGQSHTFMLSHDVDSTQAVRRKR